MEITTSTISAGELLANVASRNCRQPAVSVVITLFNYSQFIGGCLDSVRASQTEGLPGGFEVVVVDDGSTDASAKVVEKYMAAHALPICLVKKPANSGLADARNIGLQTARAPLVFILDADNEIKPDCLQEHYHASIASGCAMVYGRINQFDHATRKTLGVMSQYEWNVRELVLHPCVDAMAMIKKDVVLQLGGYSTEYGMTLPQGWEDYDLCLKLAQAGHSGKLIPKILSDYRTHPESMIHVTNCFRRELSLYFCRKFHVLVQRYPDTAQLFDFSRRELLTSSQQSPRAPTKLKSKAQKLVHWMLGRKLCRSICKRLAAAYSWMYP